MYYEFVKCIGIIFYKILWFYYSIVWDYYIKFGNVLWVVIVVVLLVCF